VQGPLGCEHCVLDGTILGQSSSLGMKGPTRHSYTEVEVMHRRRCTSNSMDVSECLASHHHLFQSCMRPKTHTTGDVNTNSAWCGRWVLLALVGSHLLIVVHLCMPNALGYSGVHTDCEGDCLALSSEYCSLAYMLAWSIKTFLLLLFKGIRFFSPRKSITL
jgi:hypothetical protein